MADNKQTETLATALNAKLEKSKGLVFAICGIVVALILIIAVVATVKSKSTEKGIEQIDSISYALTKDAADLSEDDVLARENTALEQLAPLSAKGGIVGLRANMLIAELKFAQKNYSEARSAWLKAISAKKSAYTTPLCYFNAAVCSEEMNDTDNAIAYYEAASGDEDFLLIDHALFSLGRVNESAQNYDAAKAAYEKLVELRATSNWGQLAKTRLIAMKTAGNIQ